MNPLNLLWIVPLSATSGAFLMALLAANNRDTLDLEHFQGTLKRFADHLREAGEVKAAEAVESIYKYVSRYTSDLVVDYENRQNRFK